MFWNPAWLKWSILLLLSGSTFTTPENEPGYRNIFGYDYHCAMVTLEKKQWWHDTLEINGLDPDFALAVIFPELVRYSAISDYVETKALEVLYVQYGADYADFSVGPFQMKPSFAEQIEEDIFRYNLLKDFPSLKSLHPKINDNPHLRKERIFRLKDEYSQLKYLEAFILIMKRRYPEIQNEPVEDQLVFYSTAYNTGYRKGEKIIRKESNELYFYPGIAESKQKYSYSEIALDFYKSR